MSQFLGTHQNRLDVKGRVSVPATFRTALRAATGTDGPVSLVLRKSHKLPCIEAWPLPAFQALAAPLDRLDAFGDTHDDFSIVLYADAFVLESDKEGRVMVPDALVKHAGLTGPVAFLGAGKTFQIWEPEAAEARKDQARQQLRANGSTLPGVAA